MLAALECTMGNQSQPVHTKCKPVLQTVHTKSTGLVKPSSRRRGGSFALDKRQSDLTHGYTAK